MDNSYYKLEINFTNNDENTEDAQVIEDGNFDRIEQIVIYAILNNKAKKLKEKWLNVSDMPLDLAEEKFDEYVEHFKKRL